MPVTNGWTGGQYSVFRAALGAYLFVHFAQLLPWAAELFSNRGALPSASASPLTFVFPNVLAAWDAPAVAYGLVAASAALALLFAVGWADRLAAVGMWYALACLFGRNPLISNPSLPFVGWMLLAHLLVPPAPYGSLAARGRPGPDGGWRMPQPLYRAAWVLMSLAYTYSGYTKLVSPSWVDGTAMRHVLENPLARPGMLREALLAAPDGVLAAATWLALGLELGFAPLALSRRLRPWIWGAMLGMHLGLMALVDFADLSLGMVMLHLFTFDPAWVRGSRAAEPETVFYDGHCGLCHRFVRFVLAEDRSESFRFAPLDGDAFRAAVPEARRAGLPDSVVVLTGDGRLLVRSAAVVHVFGRLGGVWRILGALVSLVPSAARDAAYDWVAGVRHRLFAPPADACPIVPRELRERFDA